MLCAEASAQASRNAAADVGPDATESLFWQSTERVATTDAYRAYLSRYPSGFFAPLATAALNKGSGSTGSAVAAASPAPAQPRAETASKLTPFFQTADSGAVMFNLGETSNGPIAHTVGWAGAKKQVVLPNGQWIALAAQDEPVEMPWATTSMVGTSRVVLATVMFGRFVDGRLASLMQFRFSSHKSPSVAWSAVDNCDRSGTMSLQSARPQTSGWRDECAALAYDASPLTAATPPIAELKRSLARMNATMQGPALVSTLSFSEKQRGYLGVTRYDWPGVAMGDATQQARDWNPVGMDNAHQSYATQLWEWTKGYQHIARDGYTNDYATFGKGLPDFSPLAMR